MKEIIRPFIAKAFCITMIFIFVLTCLLTAGNGGYALQFDGVDDNVHIVHSNKLNVTAVTIEMWIYWQASDATATQFLIGKGFEQLEIHTGYQNHQGLYVEDALRFIPTTGVYLDTEAHAISRNQWHHIAFIYDPGSSLYTCYINGKSIPLIKRGLNPVTTTLYNSIDPLLLGKRYGNAMHFQGRLDEVRIWDTARSASEIRSNMYRVPDTHPNLVVSYDMSSGSGTWLTDESSNNLHGIISGAEWKVSGALAGARRAVSLSGGNSYAKVTNSSGLQPANAFTLEAMVKINSASGTYHFIIDNGFATNQLHGGYTLGTDGTKFRTWVSNGTVRTIVLADEPFELNRWYHITSVYDGQTLTLYVDGRMAGKEDMTGIINYDRVNESPDYGLNLGRYKDDNEEFYADMVMDEIRVWSIPRSPEDVRSTMLTNLSGNEPGLLAYYRFDQTDGTIAYDQSVNGNNATLFNTTVTESGAFTTWLGTDSNNWQDEANWTGSVPGTNSNAGIYKWNALSFNPIISGSPTFKNMLISSHSDVQLNSELLIDGNLIIGTSAKLNLSAISTGSCKNLILENEAHLTINAGGILQVLHNLGLSKGAEIDLKNTP